MTEKTGVDGGSMRTVDSKAQKSMPLVEEGSVKAKAEKVTGGGSMRLVDSSMKSKAGELLIELMIATYTCIITSL
jgi:hypothetical protein